MDELGHLLTDWPHWAFEGVTDLVYTGIGALFMRGWLRRHDRRHHS